MATEDILNQVPVDDIAEKFGVSHEVAKQAVQEGGAILLGGLAKNAQSPEGSAAIEEALKKHEGRTGASTVDEIDQADGGKIVKHVLGDKEKEVTDTLTNSPQTAGIDFSKLLPILAPIIMGIIANATKSKTTTDAGQPADGGGGLGDIIGGLLGGGGSTSGGGGIGDLLGGILGGGSSKGGGGLDIGGILGGLLGGKK